MLKFVAYDKFSIYAVGASPEDAINKARDAAREPEAEFSAAPVTDAFADQIDVGGWDGNRQSFDIHEPTGIVYETKHGYCWWRISDGDEHTSYIFGGSDEAKGILEIVNEGRTSGLCMETPLTFDEAEAICL